MEHNDNQQQENRAFKKEDAYETLGIINTWIGNMDIKVSFALALAGVLIGVIFEKGMPSAFERITEVQKLAELSGGEIIAAILVALLYLSSFISILEASNPVSTPLLGHRCRSSQEITGSPTPFSTSNHYLWICASASFSLSNPNIAA